MKGSTTNNTKGQSSEKVMCIWWDWKRVFYYELLHENQTINSRKYCSKKNQLRQHRKHLGLVNWKHIMFHQNNARLHASLTTRQKLSLLGWEVLMHLLYSPDIIPSYVHLLQSFQNYFNNKNFNSMEDFKSHLKQFFAQNY